MKRKLLMLCLLAPLLVPASGIVFNRTFGGSENDYAHFVRQTAEGGYIICGQTDSYGNGQNLKPDIWVMKLDENGKKEWDKTFGGREGDVAFSIRQTSDLGYILAGSTSSFGKGYPSIWIIKLDAKGDSVWSRIYEGISVSSAHSISLTADGGYIVAGKGKENLLKLDKNGNREWGKHYGWILYSAEQTSDGGYIAAGDSVLIPQEWSYLPGVSVVKLDKAGNIEWNNPLGNSFTGSVYDIHQTDDGGYIFSGDSIALKSAFNHTHYAMVVKMNNSGKIVWKYYGGEFSALQSIRQTDEKQFIAAGNTVDSENGLNILVVLIGKDGKEIWTRSYGILNKWEYASSVALASDGGYIVAGQTESTGAGRYDWWILKLDKNGNAEPTGIFTPEKNNCNGLFLSQNYPNPFDHSTTITFQLPESGFVTLTLYDIYGRQISILFRGNLPPGHKGIILNRNGLLSGNYVYRIEFRNHSQARILTLVDH